MSSKNKPTMMPDTDPATTIAPVAKTDETPSTDPKVLIKRLPGYKLVNWTFGYRIQAGKFGVVDLQTLTPAGAARLVRKKFPYLDEVK